MKAVYKVVAWIIAGGVVLQGAMIAFAIFGLFTWVEDGGTLTAAAMEDEGITFTGVIGFPIHAIVGMMLMPLLALVLLVVSFFTKVPGAVPWAAAVLGVTVLQVLLGLFGHGMPAVGLLHGANALILFALAVAAAMRINRAHVGAPRAERVDA